MSEARVLLVALQFPVDLADLQPVVDVARGTGWHLRLLHVAAPEPAFIGYDGVGGVYDESRRERELETESAELDALAVGLRDEGLIAEALVVVGSTVDTIVEHARSAEVAQLAIIGHRHNVAHRWLLGSVASDLLELCPIPVLVLPSGTAETEEQPEIRVASALKRLINGFETDHPDLTKAINDVSYYLSGMGI